jgi:hypothetical protein
MTPKPLTKEQRETLDLLMPVIVRMDSIPFNIQTLIIDVVSAEQFWREAVKNIPIVKIGDNWTCPVCQAVLAVNHSTVADHTPDCAWKLAQE